MSFVLSGADVAVALDPPQVVRADVLVDGSTIAAVGEPAPGIRRRDCSGCLIVPGNVCAHTHLYSTLARGMPNPYDPPRTFLEILQRVWWRLDRALDEDSIRAAALVGGAEALLSGTTTLIDHHASPNAVDGSLDVIADALGTLGVRAVLCYETSDRDGPGVARAGVAENRRFLARVRSGAYPMVRGMCGAHASFTLSADTLAACADVATDADTGLHIHAAEDDVDERDAETRFGRRVIERLADSGALTGRTLLAHGVHLDEGETELVRAAHSTVVHNARSNMNNAVGRAPLGRLGDDVALGTDGIDADMFEESRAAFFRRHEEDRSVGTGWPLARLAAGARVAGRCFDEPSLGRIEPGAPADLVVLDYAAPTPIEAATLASHWVFGLAATAVRDVLVAGELVVEDRRLTRLDQREFAGGATRIARRLWERAAAIGPHPFEPEGAHG